MISVSCKMEPGAVSGISNGGCVAGGSRGGTEKRPIRAAALILQGTPYGGVILIAQLSPARAAGITPACHFPHLNYLLIDSRGTNNQPGEKHVTCHGAYGSETAEEEHTLYRRDLPRGATWPLPPADSIRRHLSLFRTAPVQVIRPRRRRRRSLPTAA